MKAGAKIDVCSSIILPQFLGVPSCLNMRDGLTNTNVATIAMYNKSAICHLRTVKDIMSSPPLLGRQKIFAIA